VNIQTQEIALQALTDVHKKDIAVKEILLQRNELARDLAALSITEKVYPSQANFLLVRVTDAPGTYKYLMDKNIIVRDRSKVTLCANCIRITVGTPQENKSLITALQKL
jgi:histidinol-phosphate aminotransferase